MKRTAGHYLLLTLAIVLFVEQIYFLTTALTHESSVTTRFLVLSAGVFVSAVAAFYGFAKRIELPGVTVFALLIVQPAIGAAATAAADVPQRHATIAIVCGAIGIVLLVVVVVRNALK